MSTVLQLCVRHIQYSNRPNGLECIVRDFVLDAPPPLGSIVVVKHHGVTSTGVLRNPVYWRESESSDMNRVGAHFPIC